jgi:inner membrane protein
MYRTGHYGAAFIVYSPTVAVLTAIGLDLFAAIGGAAVWALAMLPDKDQKIPFLKHRGFTHTVHFAAIVGAILGATGAILGSGGGFRTILLFSLFGFVVGFGTISSHIAADALTPMGVEPFRGSQNYSLDVAKAANPIANYLLFAVGIIAVVLAAFVGGVVAG